MVVIEELAEIEDMFFKSSGLKISKITEEQECKEYCGYNFYLEKQYFKFRKSKITAKKVGQFVTFWRRNTLNQTEPFHGNDNIDFYVILAKEKDRLGFFIFPKHLLLEKQLLTTVGKQGKRGFRVYPTWAKVDNKQAQKTQEWQTTYFIDFKNSEEENKVILKAILLT